MTYYPNDLVPAQQKGNKRSLDPGNFRVYKKVLKFFYSGHTQGLETVTRLKGAKPQRKTEPLTVHYGSVGFKLGNIFLAGDRESVPAEVPVQEGACASFEIRNLIFRYRGQGRRRNLPNDLVAFPDQAPVARQGDLPG